MRALWLVALAVLLAGCAGPPDARAALVGYPRLGDVAVYETTGALVDLARWENGHPFATTRAKVVWAVSEGEPVIDAARAVHATYRVSVDVDEAGGRVRHAEHYVSPRHSGLVQSLYPLSQDQSVLAFDERGFPWLWGASALFGEELVDGKAYPIPLPDNLGTGFAPDLSWRAHADGAGWRLDLEGAGAEGSLWLEGGSPWPTRVALAIMDGTLAPNVRVDGTGPARIDAKLASLTTGTASVPPRDRGATWPPDDIVLRSPWDGEKPPDGETQALLYPLSEAVRDAKLLDAGVQGWLNGAKEPKLYRGSYQVEAGPVGDSTSALWLLQWVDRDERYYEVQVSRLSAPPLPAGVPRIEKSAPAEPPRNEDQGWFATADVPERIVPLGEGIRILQEVFGAPQVQVFLRSFADPPGYSYFLDGGWEVGKRYTVVYNPNTGLLEEATGPVSLRTAPQVGG